jgi:hypothetical protein
MAKPLKDPVSPPPDVPLRIFAEQWLGKDFEKLGPLLRAQSHWGYLLTNEIERQWIMQLYRLLASDQIEMSGIEIINSFVPPMTRMEKPRRRLPRVAYWEHVDFARDGITLPGGSYYSKVMVRPLASFDAPQPAPLQAKPARRVAKPRGRQAQRDRLLLEACRRIGLGPDTEAKFAFVAAREHYRADTEALGALDVKESQLFESWKRVKLLL